MFVPYTKLLSLIVVNEHTIKKLTENICRGVVANRKKQAYCR